MQLLQVLRPPPACRPSIRRAVGAVARFFGRLGALTACRPLLVLTVSMLVAAVACLGWIRFRLETEADVLCE